MALNWAMLDPATRLPIPLPHEQTIMTLEPGVDCSVLNPGPQGVKKLKEAGRLSLTDQRLIFTTPTTEGYQAAFESLSIPLHAILSTKFEQPLFAGNYLVLDIDPSPEGGLNDGTKVEIRCNNQGIFQFVGFLEKTREKAIYMKRQTAMGQGEDDHLPAYTSAEGSSSSYTDMPPGYDA